MGDDRTFLSDDGSLRERKGKLDPADEAVLRAADTGEGLIALTPELLLELAQAARLTKDEFDAMVPDVMTGERARFVRQLRCDEGYSWRAIASACHQAWDGDWSPPSNQLMGMTLCEAAARMLDEDSCAAPWNA